MISEERSQAYEKLRSLVTAVTDEYYQCKRRGGMLGPLMVSCRFEELMSDLKSHNTDLFDLIFREEMEHDIERR